jgi:hypothetical protein
MSPARVTSFAQRVAHTIVEREIAIAHEDDFGDMKVPPLYSTLLVCSLADSGANPTAFQLVLGTRSKKPLHIPLSALDAQAASRFAFECFAKVRPFPCPMVL